LIGSVNQAIALYNQAIALYNQAIALSNKAIAFPKNLRIRRVLVRMKAIRFL
jgi:hypothetical protein